MIGIFERMAQVLAAGVTAEKPVEEPAGFGPMSDDVGDRLVQQVESGFSCEFDFASFDHSYFRTWKEAVSRSTNLVVAGQNTAAQLDAILSAGEGVSRQGANVRDDYPAMLDLAYVQRFIELAGATTGGAVALRILAIHNLTAGNPSFVRRVKVRWDPLHARLENPDVQNAILWLASKEVLGVVEWIYGQRNMGNLAAETIWDELLVIENASIRRVIRFVLREC